VQHRIDRHQMHPTSPLLWLISPSNCQYSPVQLNLA
jgi:hypothetical protein